MGLMCCHGTYSLKRRRFTKDHVLLQKITGRQDQKLAVQGKILRLYEDHRIWQRDLPETMASWKSRKTLFITCQMLLMLHIMQLNTSSTCQNPVNLHIIIIVSAIVIIILSIYMLTDEFKYLGLNSTGIYRRNTLCLKNMRACDCTFTIITRTITVILVYFYPDYVPLNVSFIADFTHFMWLFYL